MIALWCERMAQFSNMMKPLSDPVMQLEALAKKPSADKEINWVTSVFMGLFHAGAVAALFF